VIAVQESFEASQKSLEGSGTTWFHDRHGLILKEYRVIELPALLVVDTEGTVIARLEPNQEALQTWRR
jgi:hypothetical protein